MSSHQIKITDSNHQQAILTADKKGNVDYKEVKGEFKVGKNFENQIVPFYWVAHDTSFSLCHSVSEFRDEIFASAPDHDYFTVKGGGYDWEFLAQLFIDEHMPELRKDIYFDSESGMFCAYSENAESLQHFALEFRKTFDDEKMIQQMTKQFDDKAKLQTAYNLKQFDGIIRELKSDVKNNPNLFYHSFEANGEIEVFEFLGSTASIRVDQALGSLKYVSSDFKVKNYDVKHNHSDSDTIRFKKLYKDEIEHHLNRKKRVKQVDNNDLSRKNVRKQKGLKR